MAKDEQVEQAETKAQGKAARFSHEQLVGMVTEIIEAGEARSAAGAVKHLRATGRGSNGRRVKAAWDEAIAKGAKVPEPAEAEPAEAQPEAERPSRSALAKMRRDDLLAWATERCLLEHLSGEEVEALSKAKLVEEVDGALLRAEVAAEHEAAAS